MTWVSHVRPIARFNYGLSTLMTETIVDMLRHILYLASWKDQGMFADARWHDPEANGAFFDEIWDAVDLSVAVIAGLQRPEEGEERIMREFNLISHNPKLPRSKLLKACDYFFNELEPSQLHRLKPQTTYAYNIPDLYANYRPKVINPAAELTSRGSTANGASPNGTSEPVPDGSKNEENMASPPSVSETEESNGSSPTGAYYLVSSSHMLTCAHRRTCGDIQR
jgi:hypothetical protein